MGSHPINLAVRFLLEIVALVTSGVWGWNQFDNWLAFVLGFGIPIILAVIWGIFAVPNDPSRSGKAPVKTPGLVRLFLELDIFIFASWSMYDLGYANESLLFGIIVALHYILSYDRIRWLLKQ